MGSPTSPDRVARALAEAGRLQSELNMFTALESEVEIDRSPAIGPLAGTPVALKDLIDHRGKVTTCGSAFYRQTASSTAPCVRSLEAAGAVIIGRTGLHEFAFGFSSENPHWGPVRNPWDPTTSPGGSSGGSAAAVAAGITPIAIGTDTGGSVRVPAAMCGTFGLKVTHGRIPLEGVFPLVPSIDTVGPLADSVDNLSLAYRVMSGEPAVEPPAGPLRLGIPQPWYDDAPLSDEVGSAFVAATADLERIGHQVVPIEMPDVVPSHHIMWAIADEVRQVHRQFRDRGETYGEDVARRLDDADRVTDAEAGEGRKWQMMIRSRFAAAMNEVDLLITPTVPVRSKVIGEEMIGEIHYRAVLSYFSAIVNHALLPAVAIPLAGTGAPPLSLQAIGPLHGESLLLGFARQLQIEGVSGFTVARTNRTATPPG